jgi:hypothetical protein
MGYEAGRARMDAEPAAAAGWVSDVEAALEQALAAWQFPRDTRTVLELLGLVITILGARAVEEGRDGTR